MALSTDPINPGAVIDRLCQATNAHDLDALTDCFAIDYRNDTPVHPGRGFQGQAQVRKNWERIFAAVPDINASVRWVADGTDVWSEWEMRGTRLDGSPHLMRGVIVFGIRQDQVGWARFYMELVQEDDSEGIDEAVRSHLALSQGADTASSHRFPRPG